MPTIKAFITKQAVATYFALTFAISWGGVVAVAGPKIPATSEEFERLLPIVVVMMLAGPSVAGILLTGLIYGKAGLRELRSRLLKWRVGARWYAAALLIAPALMTALLLALSRFSPKFLPGIVASPNKTGSVLSGAAIAPGAGIFEELGWTGFAIPTLRLRYGLLATGLIVGLPWAAWHLFGGRFGKRHSFRNALPGQLPARSFPIASRLQGAHGVGVRPYRKPARRNPDARKSNRQRADHWCSGDCRRAPFDV